MLLKSTDQNLSSSSNRPFRSIVRISLVIMMTVFAAVLTTKASASTFTVALEDLFGLRPQVSKQVSYTQVLTPVEPATMAGTGSLLTGTLTHVVVPCNEIDLKWTNTNSSNTYGDLYRSEGATFDPSGAVAVAHFEGNDKMLLTGPVTYKDTVGLIVGRTYSYRIQVVKRSGSSVKTEILDNNGITLPVTNCLTTTITTTSAAPTAVNLGSTDTITLSAHVAKGIGPSTSPITGTVTLTLKTSAGVTIFQTVPDLILDANQDVSTTIPANLISGSAGTYTLFAEYSGEANYTASQGTNTTGVGLANSTMTLTTSGASTYGDTVTFSATVIPTGPPAPTGTVRFYDGGSCALPGPQIGSSQTIDGSGIATVSTSGLNATAHTVIACYLGDSNYNGSQAAVGQTVNKATPTATLSVANSPIAYDGLDHSATVVLNSSVAGSVTNILTGGAATQTAAGTYNVAGDFVPEDTFNYNTVTGIAAGTFEIATGTISGQVQYALDPAKSVPGVVLDAPGSMHVSGTTDITGDYSMTNFGAGPYTVTASKPAQGCMSTNGIFSNDAALIAQHVVGLITLNATQLRAAKVSGPATQNVSSFDAALIAQKVVGICNSMNQTGQWEFTPSSMEHPSGVIGSTLVENYSAILKGDVNGDWNPAGVNRAAVSTTTKDSVIASIADHTAVAGSVVNVPFSISNLGGRTITSYQVDIAYDPAVVSPRTANLTGTLSEGLSIVSNVPEAGLLKIAVYGATQVSGDGTYINLGFDVIGRAGSSSPMTISAFAINDRTDEVAAVNGRLTVTTIGSGPTLRGKLMTATGEPVAGALVTLMSSNRGRGRSVTSDADGRFEFGSLQAGETYTVRAGAKGLEFSPLTISITGNLATFEMIADQ